MTKKKSPEELEQSKREAAERRAFKAGKVAGNGVKTGGKKASKAKAEKPKADAKKASKGKAKFVAKQSMKVRVRGSLNGIPLDVEKLEESINDMLAKKSKPEPKPTIAAAITELLDDDIATRKAALKRDIDASEWRHPRTVSTTNTIESTAHRQHLTERVEVETESEEALIAARGELAKAHLETTKAPRPRCSDEFRERQHGEVGRSHDDLDVRLTRDEQLETAESCAHYVASRARLKDVKKDVDTTLANLVKGYDERISTFSRAVETGVLSVPVTTIDILEAGEVRTIRADDGRIITKRKATQDELQPPLFGGEEKAGDIDVPPSGASLARDGAGDFDEDEDTTDDSNTEAAQ